MEVIAAIQWPAPGADGKVEAWPEEAVLLKIYDKSKHYIEILLRVLKIYGPCLAFEFDDGNYDMGIVLARATTSAHLDVIIL